MEEKACCVIGERKIPAAREEFFRQELRREVEAAIADGYTRFICGFDEGVELYFAKIVAQKRLENAELRLETALPYRGRLPRLLANEATRRLLFACTEIGIHGEAYAPEAYLRRDRYMLRACARVVTVFGR